MYEKIKLLALLLCNICMLSCKAQAYKSLTAAEFDKGIQQKNIQLLDVRTADEYKAGHIKNAYTANFNDPADFERRISYLDTSQPIYVYCLSGARSAAAANILAKKGYTVLALQGGINAWRAANKTVIAPTNSPQMTIQAYKTLTKSAETVLVDIGATWCPPCKVMNPIIANIEAKYAKKVTIIKVDAGVNEKVVQANQVTALPVFIVYKNGKQIWRKDGTATQAELEIALQL